MGKVRVKTFGLPEEEEKEKKKKKEKKEAKKMAKGAHGGERVVAVGPNEEEIEKVLETKPTEEGKEEPSFAKTASSTAMSTKAESKGKKEKFIKKRVRSKRYQTSVQVLDKSKIYPLSEALELLSKFQKAKFDETVELHLNTVGTGVSGTVTLPHGTGKTTKIAIASDELIEEIEGGKINFDILVATPDMMPKLAKVAKILGPRGLMPNPKNGTITLNPESLIKKFEAGQISFKNEAKTPIIHLTVGKFSFGDKKLKENIDTIIEAIKPENIQKAVLKSTMSPAIKINI